MKIALMGPPLTAPFREEQYLRALTSMLQGGANALVVSGQVENITNQRLIVELASEARLPAIHPYPEFAKTGGLVAHGVDRRDMYRHAADRRAPCGRGRY
jgi:ABC-type uncharacterized transport system substrate-binding protein